MGSHLFVVDSSPAIRRLVEEAATAEGHGVAAFTDGPSALEQAERIRPDVIIADYHLEGLTLTSFCDKLNGLDLFPGTRLVLLTNSSDRVDEATLRSRGVHGFLHKPLHLEQVRELLQALREQKVKAAAGNTPRRRSWPPESQAIGLQEGASAAPLEDLEESTIATREPVHKIAETPQPVEGEVRTTAAAAAAAAVAARRHKDAPARLEAVQSKESVPQFENRPQPTTPETGIAPTNTSLDKGSGKAKAAPLLSETVPPKAPAPPLEPKPVPVPPVTAPIPTMSQPMEPAPTIAAPPPSEAVPPQASAPPVAVPVMTTSHRKDQEPGKILDPSAEPPKVVTPTPPRPPEPPPAKPAAIQPQPKPVQVPRQQTPPPVQAAQQPKLPVTPPVQSAAVNNLPPPVEQAVGTALAALIRTLSEQSYAQSSQQLSDAVCRQVSTQLSQMVQAEIAAQLAAALPNDQLAKTIQNAVQEALPGIVAEHASAMEHAFQQEFTAKAAHVVEQTTDKLVRELAEPVVEKHLPEVVRQQMGPVEGIVKEAAEEVAAHHARQAAERIVRDVAGEQIGQLVPNTVPDIAEAQIKKEIDRLTASD